MTRGDSQKEELRDANASCGRKGAHYYSSMFPIKLKFAVGNLLCMSLIAGISPAQAGNPVQATRDATTTKPGVVSFTVESDYQKGPNKLEVLCPDEMKPGVKYPVVVVLPVNTGLDGQWGSPVEEIRKQNLQNVYQVICVVPSYDIDPWYGDFPERPASGPFIRQQAYITDIVLPLLEKEFPVSTSGSDRYLIGFSKAGFGALGLLLRNPSLFHRAAVYDCADPNPQGDIFQKWGMVNSYGSRENFDQNFFIPKLISDKKSEFQGKDRRISLLAGSLSYGGVELIHKSLKENKLSYTYTIFPGMGHAWGDGWLPMAFASILPVPVP